VLEVSLITPLFVIGIEKEKERGLIEEENDKLSTPFPNSIPSSIICENNASVSLHKAPST